jgi:hypothetical protein
VVSATDPYGRILGFKSILIKLRSIIYTESLFRVTGKVDINLFLLMCALLNDAGSSPD